LRVILGALRTGGFSGGDDANDTAARPIAVGDNQHPEWGAQAKEREAILIVRMIGIIEQDGLLVGKGRSGLIERDAVLANVLSGLG